MLNQRTKTDQQLVFAGLCILIFLGAVLRLHYIQMPIRGDEAWSFNAFASKPLAEGLSTYWSTNNHLLHTLLMHLSYVIFDNEPVWLRLPALFAGVLIIPATYAVGRAFYDPPVGLLAAALATSSSVLVEYSVNARGYTLLILFFLLMLVAARRLRNCQRFVDWTMFTVFAALGFYAIPTMVFAYPIVVVWLGLTYFIEQRSTRRLKQLRNLAISCLATGVLTLLLYAPALIYVARLDSSALTDLKNGIPNPLQVFIPLLIEAIRDIWLQSWMRDLPDATHIVLGGAVVLGIIFHRRLARYSIPLVFAILVGLIPVLLLLRPIFLSRTWLFLLPLYLITAAAGIKFAVSLITRRSHSTLIITIGAIILTLVFSLLVVRKGSIYLDTETGNVIHEPKNVINFLHTTMHAGDRIVVQQSASMILSYYSRKAGIPFDDNSYVIWTGPFKTTQSLGLPENLFIMTERRMSPETVQQMIIMSLNLDQTHYQTLKLIQTFDNNQVYLLHSIDS